MAGSRPFVLTRPLPGFRPAVTTALSATRMFRGTALLLAVTAAHGTVLVLLMMLGALFPLRQAVRETPADLIASGGAE